LSKEIGISFPDLHKLLSSLYVLLRKLGHLFAAQAAFDFRFKEAIDGFACSL